MGQGTQTLVKVGEVVAGRYRIDHMLGRGAMGIVVAATHLELHQRRAIKFMLPEALEDKESVERFLREARAVARLESKHTVKVYDVARLPTGEPYIVMEYLEGIDLKKHLALKRVLPVPEAASFILQACEAIAEAHAAGIIHRDLKPANMFLAERSGGEPCLKVLDFGIAKVNDSSSSDGQLTSTHTVIGSPLYMSPEQILSTKNVDTRSDVWSLGVILYTLVTGMVPFRGDSTHAIFASVQRDDPIPPSNWVPHLPHELELVILRCLEKDPNLRCQSAGELAAGILPFAPESARRAFPSAYLPAVPAGGLETATATQVWRPPSPQGAAPQSGPQGAAPQSAPQGYSQQAYAQGGAPGYPQGAASTGSGGPHGGYAHAASGGYAHAAPAGYAQLPSPSYPSAGPQGYAHAAPPSSHPQPSPPTYPPPSAPSSHPQAAPPSYPQPGAQTNSPITQPVDAAPRTRGREALLALGGFATALVVVGAFFLFSRGDGDSKGNAANSEALPPDPAALTAPAQPPSAAAPAASAGPSAAPSATEAPASTATPAGAPTEGAAKTTSPPPSTASPPPAAPPKPAPFPVSKPATAPTPTQTSKPPAPTSTSTSGVPLKKRHD